MKLLTTLLLATIVFTSCDKDDADDCTSIDFTYRFATSKQVDTVHVAPGLVYANVINGTDQVFVYRKETHVGCGMADGDVLETLVFQVPAAATSFNYNTDALLAAANSYFIKQCFCADVSARLVTGSISGTKTGDQWNLQINVQEAQTQSSIVLTKRFTLN